MDNLETIRTSVERLLGVGNLSDLIDLSFWTERKREELYASLETTYRITINRENVPDTIGNLVRYVNDAYKRERK